MGLAVVVGLTACAAGHRGGSTSTSGQAATAPTGGLSGRARVVRRVKIGAMPYDVVAGFGSVWIAATDGVDRFAPATGRLEGRTTIRHGGEWMNIAAGGGTIWYASAGKLVAIDPSGGQIVRVIRLGPATGREAYEFVGASSQGVCVGQIAPTRRTGLLCVAGKEGRVTRITAGPGPIAGASDGSLWVGGASLERLTLTPRTMTSIHLPSKASVDALAASGGSVWAALNFESRTSARSELWQLRRGHVIRRLAVPKAWVASLAPTRSGIWLLTRRLHGHKSEIEFVRPNGGLDTASSVAVAMNSRGLAGTDSSVWTVQYRPATATIVARR